MDRRLWLALFLFWCCVGGRPALADERAPKLKKLTLAEYARSYYKLSNKLREGKILVAQREVELQRRQQRATMELSASPFWGLNLFHFTSEMDPLVPGTSGVEAEYSYNLNNGQSLSVQARASLPTRPTQPTGDFQYGVSGEYTYPLLKNRGGRQFRLEAKIQTELKKKEQASLKLTGLQICHDATRRYIERYVAQQKLAVYRDLLREKRRVYGQTTADYRRRLVTRLDLLAARSDWMAAKSKEPDLVSRLQQADAVLRAYYPVQGPLELQQPPEAAGLSLGATGIMRWAHDEDSHPRFLVLTAARKALGQERDWLLEQNRSELDLSLSLGLHRYHSAYSQILQTGGGLSLQMGDVTDLGSMFSVRYLLPIRRPDVSFKLRLLKLSQRRIDEQRAQLRRGISSDVARVSAVIRNADVAIKLIEQQLRVARQQIRAAHKQYRKGKLEFQNFLDHWEPYQRARLRYWDTMRQRLLAESDLILLLNQRPEYCP